MPRSKPEQRASVAVALIAYNAEKTLGACLDSIRPYVTQIVVGVDEKTTDKTAKVARQHGADLVFPLKVSDWHECKDHGKILVQHFGNARTESFKRLRKDVDWWLWIDADDVLVGAEKLAGLLSKVPSDRNCVWLEYRYSTVNDGAGITTTFDRERFLRTTCEWEWTHRVHETVAPVGVPVRPIRFGRDMHVWHQEGAHKSEGSAERNHRLIEIELEEDPSNSRSVFYMANGLFAQRRWAEATEWYARVGMDRQANPYERWQAYCYLSMACEQVGDADGAVQAAWMAIDLLPQFKEPYYRLAAMALITGEPDKCIYWTGVADSKEEPPYFVFKNPMEYSFNSRTALADAYYAKGEVHKALTAAQAANAVAPSESLKKAIIHYQELIQWWERANAFVGICPVLSDDEVVRLYGLLPLDVRQFGRVRNVGVPAIIRLREQRFAA